MHRWQNKPTDGPKGGWCSEYFFPLSLSLHLSVSLSISISLSISLYLSSYLSVCLSIYLSRYLSLSLSLSVHPSIDLSIHCIFLSIHILHLSIYLSIWKETILRDFVQKWKLTGSKRSNSAKLSRRITVLSFKTMTALTTVAASVRRKFDF